ncbi:Ras-specific guanine nucleotide-releasing factor 1 [Mizuhopecten yessoensis]|uniref:Ras-specific guanine nucleotide-releasing factor 1 n=1 Tax=Mizuhopecten yessoensis TaxID=6573 RepID=A0A210Q9B7_MIZYE|nr:Ras-specific guanine nucleotide-releasing factor 1 [Mizuhopecten yessoensis]
MHDEVSETENIRKNLSIERMIVEGCDILLDVNQTFVRQGALLQVFNEKGKFGRGRLGSFSSSFKESKKEVVRQVFLFTNHMLLTTRSSNGRLHLAKHYGKIPLIDCTLIEDPSTEICFFDDETASVDSSFSLLSVTSGATLLSTQSCERDARPDYNGLDFKIIVDSKSGPPTTITLVASTHQEKIAWCSDISQCIENLHYSDLLNTSMSESSSVTMPQSVRSDPKLFRDDVDIKFSRTLNSCKVPQIRHASVERLLDRLTDLRFLSIDFLNTFLLTYRVFTTGKTVLEALKRVYKNPECGNLESGSSSCQSSSDTDIYGAGGSPPQFTGEPPSTHKLMIKPHAEKPRRISTGCMNIEVTGSTLSKPPHAQPQPLTKDLESETTKPKDQQRRVSFHKLERGDSVDTGDSDDSRSELASYLFPPRAKLAPIASLETLCDPEITLPDVPAITTNDLLTTGIMLPDVPGESSVDDFDSKYSIDFASPSDYENELSDTRQSSSYTLVSAASSDTLTPGTPRISPMPSPRISPRMIHGYTNGSPRSMSPRRPCSPSKPLFTGSDFKILDALALSPTSSPIRVIKPHTVSSPIRIPSPIRSTSPSHQIASPIRRPSSPGPQQVTSPIRRPSSPRLSSPGRSPSCSPKPRRAPSPISASMSSPNILMPHIKIRPTKRGSTEVESIGSITPRSSIVTLIEGSPPPAKAGAVVTSSRRSKRRSSSSTAMTAFAVATAGSAYQSEQQQQQQQQQQGQPIVQTPTTQPQQSSQPAQPPQQPPKRYLSTGAVVTDPRLLKKRESVISTAATMRVLNIIKHWVSKHQQDFECDIELKRAVIDMLEEMACNTSLVPTEQKAAASILRTVTKENEEIKRVDLTKLLTPPEVSTKDTFDTLSALDIAEQLTYLDHKIYIGIRSEELLGQAWMKPDKSHKAPHVLLVSKRFNEVSRLVVSEIVGRQNLQDRVSCIEKWAAIADICRCMHNYNGVLQICAAFVNSSVYRLKKTWEKLSKQTKQMIERLQVLVSSDGRFKNMRDALHRCDPPCIPYLGMYLTDLSFIEEGTPDNTDEGLVNFSKMRMIAHVIREIRLFQQTPYRIEHHVRITNYLLDPNRLLGDDRTYKASLEIEPKQSRLSTVSLAPS